MIPHRFLNAPFRAAALCVPIALGLFFSPGAAFGAEGGVESERRDLLRVCSDPSHMPFSNRDGMGFENRIAELIARDLDLRLSYVWYPRTMGFIRRTLNARLCDLIMAVPVGFELTLSTNPYYRSAYVMAQRADDPVRPTSLSDYATDPDLAGARIGVIAGSPPATIIARLDLFDRMRSYHLLADTRHNDPSARMIDDLIAGEIDLALLWGPIGGWLAEQSVETPLRLTPLSSETEDVKLDFWIAMGVRRGEILWKRKLNEILENRRDDIDEILRDYGVPMLNLQGETLTASQE